MLMARVDSMSFRIRLEELDSINGIIVETLKHGIIQPNKEQLQRYRAVTGRSYHKVIRASSVFLIEHERGQTFTAIRWGNSCFIDIAIHGLQQYDFDGNLSEGSLQRKLALVEILKQLAGFKILRVDFSIDFKKIPPRIIKNLESKRHAKQVKSTTYYQPLNQRERENSRLKIMVYDKALKNDLSLEITRLEFGLKSKYWCKQNINLGDVNTIIESKGIDVIRRWTGERVEVTKFIS